MTNAAQTFLLADHGEQFEEARPHPSTSHCEPERVNQLSGAYAICFGILANDRLKRVVIPMLTGFEFRYQLT